MRRPGLLASTWVLFRKDLLLEWRSRARVNALLFFSLATLLLFSFALGPDTALLRRNAGGYLWLALLLASVLALGESFRVERENATLEGLRLVPVNARAIFLAKAVANAVLLAGLGGLLVPVLVALLDVRIVLPVGQLLGLILLGCLAIAAPGTLYGAIASHARARDVLLPLLLFPILIPALVAAAKGTALVFEGDPMGQFPSWVALLTSFDLIYWGLGVLLFPRVVEE
ncbi:MAG TPA: heme exporter protein CcmB [Myxococcaceae bacterium]|nr:heme exporter protein CcmB [Myxococcaceae bacterium]